MFKKRIKFLINLKNWGKHLKTIKVIAVDFNFNRKIKIKKFKLFKKI